MALGAALATGKPQTYAVVPGPGLLDSSAALLTAYGVNAPVLALVGKSPRPPSAGGSGICTRSATRPASSPAWLISPRAFVNPPRRQLVAEAFPRNGDERPGPAVLECAMDVWGRGTPMMAIALFLPAATPPVDDEAAEDAARRLAAAKRPLIVVGGGAEAPAAEVGELSTFCRHRSSPIGAVAACSTAEYL